MMHSCVHVCFHGIFYLFLLDDGCVRVWRHYAAEDDCSGGAHQVTAWRALTDIIPSSNLKSAYCHTL